MNTTQISPLVETCTEEPMWQDFTEQEQEKIRGGKFVPGFQYFNGKRLLRVYKNRCEVLPAWHAFLPFQPMPTIFQ